MTGYKYQRRSDGRKISSISMTDSNNDSHESSLQNQIIACLICNLGSFSFGSVIGWSSPSLPVLQKLEILTEEQSAWAGGLLPLGALASLPIFGYIARARGRKPAAYVIGIPLAVGFAMKAWGGSAPWLLVGRFLCGLGSGAAISLPPLYVGEICEPRGRGLLSSMMMAMYSIGLLMAYTLGAVLPDVELLPVTLLPIPLLFMVAFWFMPETPIYRLRMGQEEEAARALAWLRKLPLNSKEIKEELTQMAARLGLELPLPAPLPKPRLIGRRHTQTRVLYVRSTSQQDSNKVAALEDTEKIGNLDVTTASNNGLKQAASSLKQLVKSRAGLRGMGLCLALVSAQTFMGLFAVSVYAASIFEKARTGFDENTCAILFAVVVAIGSVLGSLLMDKAGRRVLQIGSCILVGVSELVMALCLQAVDRNDDVADWVRWTPLAAMAICVLSYNMGAGNMPFVIVSEIFAPEVQDVATNIVMAYVWLMVFLLLQFFPACVNALGIYNVFYFFSGVSLFSALFSYFFLIETKGKSLEEILQKLSGEKPKYSMPRTDADNENNEMLLKA